MARFYRRYRSSYGRRYWRRTGWTRRYGGVRKAQQQGNRRFSVTIPVEGTTEVPIQAGQTGSYSIVFQPFYNSNSAAPVGDVWGKYGNVIQNDVFQVYTRLYDEVKVDSCSLSVAVQGLPAVVNGCKVVTAVDRHTNLADVFNQRSIAQMLGAPESVSRTFTSLQNARIWRAVYARDLSERTMFMDSSLGTRDVAATQTAAAYQQQGLMEFLENGGYGCFIPGFTVAFQLPAAPVANSNVVIQWKVNWKFTFRNPKFNVSSVRGVGFSEMKSDVGKDVVGESKDDVVLPVVEDVSPSKKFDDLSDEEKARIMELIGSMEDEKGA